MTRAQTPQTLFVTIVFSLVAIPSQQFARRAPNFPEPDWWPTVSGLRVFTFCLLFRSFKSQRKVQASPKTHCLMPHLSLCLWYLSYLSPCWTEGRTSVQTHCYLNKILKFLWMGLSTVCRIDSLRRNHPAEWLEEISPVSPGRGCSLVTLREDYFLSLLSSWEAWETPASWLLYSLWEGAWRFLCWNKNEGEALQTSVITSTIGAAVAVPMCPSQSLAGEYSCTVQLSQSKWKVSPVTLQAWVSSAACPSSFLPLLGLHDCTMALLKGLNTSKSCQQHLTLLPNAQQHSAPRAQDKEEDISDQSIKISVTRFWAWLVNALRKWWGEKSQKGKGEDREGVMLQLFC